MWTSTFIRRISGAAALAVVGWAAWPRDDGPKRTPAPVQVEDSDLDLGELPAHQTSVHEVGLTNQGRVPLTVQLSSSCQCTAIEPSRFRLDVAESRRVALTIAPPPPSNEGFEWSLGVVLTARCEDDSGGARSRRSWRLNGIVSRPVYLEPPVIAFTGPNEIVQGELGTCNLMVRTRTPLADVRTSVTPDLGDVQVHDRGDEIAIEYRHRGAEHLGDFSARMRVTPIAIDGKELSSITVPIEGRVVAPYRLSPEDVVFPVARIGKPLEQSLSILSLKGAPFQVTLPEMLDDEITLTLDDRSSDSTPQGVTLSVTLRTPGRRQWEAPLVVEPAIPDAQPVELRLQVRAYGLAETVRAPNGGEIP